MKYDKLPGCRLAKRNKRLETNKSFQTIITEQIASAFANVSPSTACLLSLQRKSRLILRGIGQWWWSVVIRHNLNNFQTITCLNAYHPQTGQTLIEVSCNIYGASNGTKLSVGYLTMVWGSVGYTRFLKYVKRYSKPCFRMRPKMRPIPIAYRWQIQQV